MGGSTATDPKTLNPKPLADIVVLVTLSIYVVGYVTWTNVVLQLFRLLGFRVQDFGFRI